jgi:hypothetical protein
MRWCWEGILGSSCAGIISFWIADHLRRMLFNALGIWLGSRFAGQSPDLDWMGMMRMGLRLPANWHLIAVTGITAGTLLYLLRATAPSPSQQRRREGIFYGILVGFFLVIRLLTDFVLDVRLITLLVPDLLQVGATLILLRGGIWLTERMVERIGLSP